MNESTADPKQLWESRYGTDAYLYGTEPNDFLRSAAAALTIGSALCIADGEGRNGVYLATLGHDVTSVDFTASGMAKASRLAAQAGVELVTLVADLVEFDFGIDRWDLVVSIFAHTPPPLRRRVHASIAAALRPGGTFILEAYTPDQLGRGTGGPPVAELAMTLDGLRSELTNLHLEHAQETVRNLIEGPGHTGDGAVVQVVAVHANH